MTISVVSFSLAFETAPIAQASTPSMGFSRRFWPCAKVPLREPACVMEGVPQNLLKIHIFCSQGAIKLNSSVPSIRSSSTPYGRSR